MMINTTISRINKILLTILSIFIILEIIFYPSTENIYGSFVLALSFYVTQRLVFTYENIKKHFISFFILFSYTFCFSFMPFLATLLNKSPLIYKFEVPYLTFNYHFLFQISLICAFLIAKKIGKKRNIVRSFLLKHTNYFNPLQPKIIYWLGVIGIVALFSAKMFRGEGIISKISGGSFFLIACPLVLLFPHLYTRTYIPPFTKSSNKMVWLFVICSFLIGIAANSRSTMFFMVLMIFLLYLTQQLIFNKTSIFLSWKKLLPILFLCFIITGPLTDLASAVVLVRNQRTDLSPTELFSQTLNLYRNKEVLYKIQKEYEQIHSTYAENNKEGWSEEYTGNIFLDRFCNLRVSDATLYYAKHLGFNNPEMRKNFYNNLLSILPTPILNIFGINSQIKEVIEYSGGDKLYSLAMKDSHALGGFRVCGYTGIGLATFGHFFFLIVIFVYTIIFYLVDSLTLPLSNKNTIIPIGTLIQLYSFFYFLNNGDGITRNITFLIRGFIQSILIYLLVVWLIQRFFISNKIA